ncbi:hypothetical protein F4X86_02310 [Candidatus Saccharibacteria bacterium]|nr:hypothetical protein [Candidatus Saccharibacteria bacterium]
METVRGLAEDYKPRRELQGSIGADKLAASKEVLDEFKDISWAMEKFEVNFFDSLKGLNREESKDLAMLLAYHCCVHRSVLYHFYLHQDEVAAGRFRGGWNYFRKTLHDDLTGHYGWSSDRVVWAFNEFDLYIEEDLRQALLESVPFREKMGKALIGNLNLFENPETTRRFVRNILELSEANQHELAARLELGYFSEETSLLAQDFKRWVEILAYSYDTASRSAS